jgi:MerR family transcriptional regulator, light-induced transcriptional regulator
MASFIRTGYSPVGTSTLYDGPEMENCRAAVSSETVQRERANKLRTTVEAEIIPRLMMLHRGLKQSDDHAANNDNARSDFDIVEFCEVVLDHDLQTAQVYIERLMDQGVALDSILLGLMAPTARHLGELWESDARSFAEVTIALGHLHLLLRLYGPALEVTCCDDALDCRMMLSPVRGDRHIFGLCVLDLYLRQAGGEVELFPRFELPAMTRKVKSEWVDVIGLSASCDVLIGELSSDIRSLRRASFNNSVEVIVGGPAFVGHPERVASVGADGFAGDAPEAVRLVSGIMKKSARG